MISYTNKTGVSLPLAVWLATDNYDGKSSGNPYQISVTSLLKSTRQTVLEMRNRNADRELDVTDILKSKIGNAIHDSIEQSWKSDNLSKVIESLGFPGEVANKIVINPTEVLPGQIPVYMEQRSFKQIGKWTLTGKFDYVFDGFLKDFKSTGTYTYVKGIKDDDYIKQGSSYRWLNPKIITKDNMEIDFIFTDWKKSGLSQENYPPAPVHTKHFPLMPTQETEQWVTERLNLIEACELIDESDLPFCTDAELWRGPSVFKYYASGKVTARSTKNFDNAHDAYQRNIDDGNKGLVVEIKGEPTACLYCSVSAFCSQKNAYIHSGELVL